MDVKITKLKKIVFIMKDLIEHPTQIFLRFWKFECKKD